ncbi:DUF2271 domain-containing protein [Primorskyibacter flagellatus]|uniref:DUF2271 domain-containing protein n=1 Tax=Primorskyibacter flagellatus TaxID=1387277 RepID=UPI003A8FD377
MKTGPTLPGLAMARPVTLTTTLNNYGGDGAYLALYVTDASSAYVGSLWMAGGKSKYYEHLSDWLRAWQETGLLTRLVTAVSRGANPHYVQGALRGDADQVAQLIRDGARVMVCGGRDMAAGVADALAEILAPTGLTPAVLKAEGRYVEDVY